MKFLVEDKEGVPVETVAIDQSSDHVLAEEIDWVCRDPVQSGRN